MVAPDTLLENITLSGTSTEGVARAGPGPNVTPADAVEEVVGAGPGPNVTPVDADEEVVGAGPGPNVTPVDADEEVVGAGPGPNVTPVDADEDVEGTCPGPNVTEEIPPSEIEFDNNELVATFVTELDFGTSPLLPETRLLSIETTLNVLPLARAGLSLFDPPPPQAASKDGMISKIQTLGVSKVRFKIDIMKFLNEWIRG